MGGDLVTGGNLFVGGTEQTAIAGQTFITDSSDSTSTSTGALLVTGGAGLGGSVHMGGDLVTGGNLFVGGLENTAIAGETTITNTNESIDINTGALIVNGGVGVASNLNMGGNLTVTGTFHIESTQQSIIDGQTHFTYDEDSHSTTSGTVLVSGGVGVTGNVMLGGNITVGKEVYVNGNINVFGSGISYIDGPTQFSDIMNIVDDTGSTEYTNGALVVSGGVGIGGNVNIDGNLETGKHVYTQGNLDVVNSITTSGQLYITGTDRTQIDGNILINTANDSHITGNLMYTGPEFNQYNPILYPGQFVTRSYLNSFNTNTFWLYSTNGNVWTHSYLGIGISDPEYPLDVSGTVTATAYNSTSDYRIKKNVEPLKEERKIDRLIPVEYDLNDGKHDMGFLAHEVQEVFPFLVTGEKDGEKIQSINYNGMIAVLVKEIQSLKAANTLLEQRVKSIEDQI